MAVYIPLAGHRKIFTIDGGGIRGLIPSLFQVSQNVGGSGDGEHRNGAHEDFSRRDGLVGDHKAAEPAGQVALMSLGLYSVTGKLVARTWQSLLSEGERLRRPRPAAIPERPKKAGFELELTIDERDGRSVGVSPAQRVSDRRRCRTNPTTRAIP